jgi:P pilus assembly chaperone PapD
MRPALLSALAIVAAATSSAAPAQPAPAATATATVGANLNLTPKRITFDRNRRNGTVYIYNQGSAPATFDVSLVDRVMLPDGQLVAPAPDESRPEVKAALQQLKSAQSVFLVSPRRVTLPPGQGQTIRLRVASVPEGASGEYRTHLTVTTIPPPTTGLTADAAAAGQPGELSFQITSVFGISIPAIVRFSDPDVRAGIQDAHLEFAELSLDGKSPPRRTPIMAFDLTRLGPNSLFGNVEIRSLGQKGDPLGFARGVGVYPEVAKRRVRVPLTHEPRPGDRLEITFTDDDTSPGKLLAKLDL